MLTKLKQNLVPRFCKERNVFIPVAPIRRDLHKKLHKVLHLFLPRTFGA